MTPKINLYAEFLMNIRQVTIYATLEEEHKSSSDVLISSDKKTLSVTYEDASATITFPTGILGTAKVEFPVEKRKVISLRLEIAEEDEPSHGIGMDVGNDSPWPAASLSSETRIACRSCHEVIVDASQRVWKDLPREHWAEMMDLWHCHKPHTELPEDANVTGKGYSAQSRPRLRDGLGFVDTCHIFVSSSEVKGSKTLGGVISCSSCNTSLGVFDEDFGGIKFYKWSILLQLDSCKPWEQNAVQNFVCAQMLAIVDSQAIKKFMAFPSDVHTPETGLLLWVFNPDVKYSASFIRNGQPRRAMKIMYKLISKPLELLDKDDTIEELRLPSEVLSTIKSDLAASNEILPPAAQVLQDWKVALLDRFEPVAAVKDG